MKTQSLFEIAIEAIATVILIALLGLLTVLVYMLLSLLNPESAQVTYLPILGATEKNLAIAKATLSDTTTAFSPVKPAPNLEEKQQVECPENIAEVSTKSKTDYRKLTLKELRPLARDLNIPSWQKLKKPELISALNV